MVAVEPPWLGEISRLLTILSAHAPVVSAGRRVAAFHRGHHRGVL